MVKKISLFFVSIICLCLSSCEKFEYSPYQTDNTVRPENLNKKNLDRLLANESLADDTVKFLFSGDSQRFYDELEDLVKAAKNIPDLDFFILSGDISDFGLLEEFLWINEEMERLNVPYISVVGNHDLLAHGADIYQQMYGAKNFSFKYKGYKFICHDSNGREYNFNGQAPDVPWLRQELNDPSAEWIIPISHVPPFNTEDYDPALVGPYTRLMASNRKVLASFHAHIGSTSDWYPYQDGVRYIVSNQVRIRECMLITLVNGVITKEFISY